MRAAQLAALALLAACSGGSTPIGPDPVDADQVDAAVDAGIDAMVCPEPPEGDDPPLDPPGDIVPPAGVYFGTWRCASAECAGQPAGDITRATRLDIVTTGTGAQLTWSGGPGDPVVLEGLRSGACWRIPREAIYCVKYFDVCRERATAIERWDFDAHDWQRWRWPN